MFSEAKVTEIFCMADDFCKEFAKTQEKYMVDLPKHRKNIWLKTRIISIGISRTG